MKKIFFDVKAFKELKLFPRIALAKMHGSLRVLANKGFLEEPTGKKLDTNLFEIRVKSQGEWRVFYSYIPSEKIIVLSAFHKKTQKTPKKEIEKAKKRLLGYGI